MKICLEINISLDRRILQLGIKKEQINCNEGEVSK